MNSTGVYVDGASPTVPSQTLAGSAIDLHGHVFHAHVTYDGASLGMTITDEATGGSSSYGRTIDIPGTVGATSAWVGFTGGTGGLSATQEILSWTYGP